MIYFPNAKINIGLFVTSKREDNFHNIESIFYPIGLNDALELRISQSNETKLTIFGENIKDNVSNGQSNTVLKAYNLLKKDFAQIRPANICLDKKIPVFAGLGGGSSDATFMLKLVNYMYDLHLSENKLYDYAAKIGSDCMFFLKNTPQFVYSRGDKMQEVSLSLTGHYLVLIKPNINISTKEAYSNVHKTPTPFDLRGIDVKDIKNWKDCVKNDFEVNIFSTYPLLRAIKEMLYDNGAVYSQMSGSGSTIYGIFEKKADLDAIKQELKRLNAAKDTFIYQERLK